MLLTDIEIDEALIVNASWGPEDENWEDEEEIRSQAIETVYNDLCETCQQTEFQGSCDQDCQKIIDDERLELKTLVAEWLRDACCDERYEWEQVIDQEPGGNFVKYDQVSQARSTLTSFEGQRRYDLEYILTVFSFSISVLDWRCSSPINIVRRKSRQQRTGMTIGIKRTSRRARCATSYYPAVLLRRRQILALVASVVLSLPVRYPLLLGIRRKE